jgi:hypothetical protein
MFSRRTSVLASIIATVMLLLACQLPAPGQPGPTPGSGPGAQQELAAYITSEFIPFDTPHYVTWVPPTSEAGPLPTGTVLGAWKCEGGVCLKVPFAEPDQKMRAETGRQWQYSYYAFAIVSLSAAGTRATILLDEAHGPLAGAGYEITLVKQGSQWVEEGQRKMRWIS